MTGTLVVLMFLTHTGELFSQEESNDVQHRNDKDLPLEGWDKNRSIAIDLDEGAWISLDVSPTGETIARYTSRS